MGSIVFVGNFSFPWCSEVHWARELRSLGWQVEQFQEPQHPKDGRDFLRRLEEWCVDYRPALVVYTRTWGLPPEAALTWQRLKKMGVVTCSYHLDLYAGLPRESDIGNDPFWMTEHVFTADGDPRSAEIFKARGVNHHWLSPAVVSDECVPGEWREEYAYDVVFVGSKHYHPEWPWRPQMIEFLEGRYGKRFRRFNKDMPEGPTRCMDLNDLFASAKVVVGDALVPPGHVNYWSDRYFETIGRGGFLIAPAVPGIENFLEEGEHFVGYQHPREGFTTDQALDALGEEVDYWLEHEVYRMAIQVVGQQHVADNHTYRHRWQEALDVMNVTRNVIQRLELGSGFSPTPGFTHLDLNPAAPDVDIVGAAWPLDLPDNSVGELRAVDVLEHISYWDTDKVLADWFRVLVPGGKLFVQVPDADLIMRTYVTEPWKLTPRLPSGLPITGLAGATWRLLGGHNDGVYVKDGQDFRLNAHYAMFSAESLTQALENAGFEIASLTINPHPNVLCEAIKPKPSPRVTARARTAPNESREVVPKIGLIARGETARGLALMTKCFYDHMPVERVLLATILNRDTGMFGDNWYPGATGIDVESGYRIDEKTAREWLEGLDVVYTAETPYDWRMPRWCREAGVKLVVHGMPEFVRHGQPSAAHLEHPDEWWWPTSWLVERMPPGTVVPVPMPDHEPTAAPADDRELRIYHVAGKRAFADRNGTDTFIQALRAFDKRTITTIYGLEGSLPEIAIPRNAIVNIDNVGTADRWDMHQGQHLLVLPRRYAGLCLPALEAASRGMAVMMPDVSPNRELASVLVPPMAGKSIRVPCGKIDTFGIHFFALAEEVNALNKDRERLALAMKQSYDMVPRWSEYRQVYLDHFARICS